MGTDFALSKPVDILVHKPGDLVKHRDDVLRQIDWLKEHLVSPANYMGVPGLDPQSPTILLIDQLGHSHTKKYQVRWDLWFDLQNALAAIMRDLPPHSSHSLRIRADFLNLTQSLFDFEYRLHLSRVAMRKNSPGFLEGFEQEYTRRSAGLHTLTGTPLLGTLEDMFHRFSIVSVKKVSDSVKNNQGPLNATDIGRLSLEERTTAESMSVLLNVWIQLVTLAQRQPSRSTYLLKSHLVSNVFGGKRSKNFFEAIQEMKHPVDGPTYASAIKIALEEFIPTPRVFSLYFEGGTDFESDALGIFTSYLKHESIEQKELRSLVGLLRYSNVKEKISVTSKSVVPFLSEIEASLGPGLLNQEQTRTLAEIIKYVIPRIDFLGHAETKTQIERIISKGLDHSSEEIKVAAMSVLFSSFSEATPGLVRRIGLLLSSEYASNLVNGVLSPAHHLQSSFYPRLRRRGTNEPLPFGQDTCEFWALSMLNSNRLSLRKEGWDFIRHTGLKTQKIVDRSIELLKGDADSLLRSYGKYPLFVLGQFLGLSLTSDSKPNCADAALGTGS